MEIAYGDCTSTGGYCYRLLLDDVDTRYCWFYGLKSTTLNEIINALSQFRADLGHPPCQFHSDFYQKIMGGNCLRWIINNKSKIITAPAKRQISNGLFGRTWRTPVQMSRT